ncbi:MAG TPA: TIGR00730 family Rossman fold protein [Lachnospiraceae bacterium]|nr:TIGR00730 family Rossman fold protein [Lachnospiraceae bacterium]HPF29989.1 TIGR00730 family Rossman fold protein [Lachnospiraceae bacterium]
MKICIYGASSNTIPQIYFEETGKLAAALAKTGHALVFGGGCGGMMGECARRFDEEHATIIGIAPGFFHEPGVLYENCTQLIRTDTMRERKQKMEELSDVFIAVPGGFGTFDEVFEIITLRQLQQHEKPVILYNINGFYDPLIVFIEKIKADNFIRGGGNYFQVAATPQEVLDIL